MSLSTRSIVQAVYELASAEDRVLGSTGLISRHLHDFAADDPRCFYMIGSMGLALSLAAGIATAAPRGRTIVLDGDGACMMGLASLLLASDLRPIALHHVVIANSLYLSTGGQTLPGKHADLSAMARAAGYVETAHVSTLAELRAGAASFWSGAGPTLLVAHADDAMDAMPSRVAIPAERIQQAFRERSRRANA